MGRVPALCYAIGYSCPGKDVSSTTFPPPFLILYSHSPGARLPPTGPLSPAPRPPAPAPAPLRITPAIHTFRPTPLEPAKTATLFNF